MIPDCNNYDHSQRSTYAWFKFYWYPAMTFPVMWDGKEANTYDICAFKTVANSPSQLCPQQKRLHRKTVYHLTNGWCCCQALSIDVLTFNEYNSCYPQLAASCKRVLNHKHVKSTPWNASSFHFFKDSWKRHRQATPLNAVFWCVALWAHTERLFCEVQEIRDGEVLNVW